MLERPPVTVDRLGQHAVHVEADDVLARSCLPLQSEHNVGAILPLVGREEAAEIDLE